MSLIPRIILYLWCLLGLAGSVQANKGVLVSSKDIKDTYCIQKGRCSVSGQTNCTVFDDFGHTAINRAKKRYSRRFIGSGVSKSYLCAEKDDAHAYSCYLTSDNLSNVVLIPAQTSALISGCYHLLHSCLTALHLYHIY
jgi:hypothetical protein